MSESKDKRAGLDYLVAKSANMRRVIEELKATVEVTSTGITNFVVNHENPLLVESILLEAFKTNQLFNETVKFDAVELQHGRPGKGSSVRYFDELIYGTYKTKITKDGETVPDMDEALGIFHREENGLTTRASIKRKLKDEGCKDRILVISNMDYSLDFCKTDHPGQIDTRALFLLDKFRHPTVRNGCVLILVTNKRLDLPFPVNTVEINPVSRFEVIHILNIFIKFYRDQNVRLLINETEAKQITRKLTGLSYCGACDALAYCLTRSKATKDGVDTIDMSKVLKLLRTKVNKDLMTGGFGLAQLEARPWEDYICPEQSNFTYDVKKLMRDFKEVEHLTEERKTLSKDLKSEKNQSKFDHGLEKVGDLEKDIEDIQTRMPHVIVLHGQGGVGKSAFPVHLAGLLDMDVWDFNVNATHSKWIGQGGEQMRESLDKITQSSHIILRIDEYDRAMGSTNERGGGMHEAHKQVESEFMNWLQNSQEDNIFAKRNIFVVMTTNHVDNITGPMLRSGRADLVIDIGSFDSASMREAFETCARRMHNRGVSVVGFKTPELLQTEINSLDLEKLSELAMTKKFTVRDIEMLIIEMSAHRYYFNKHGEGAGIPWTSESFVKVLENSEGSVKGASTGELKLGDRDFYTEDPEDIKVEFEDSVSHVDKLKKTTGFKEV